MGCPCGKSAEQRRQERLERKQRLAAAAETRRAIRAEKEAELLAKAQR